MDPGRERHVGAMAHQVEQPVAEDSREQQPRATWVVFPQEPDAREHCAPDRAHEQAVTIDNVATDHAIRRRTGHGVEVLDAGDQENKRDQIDKHRGEDYCAERKLRLDPLYCHADSEVSNEHATRPICRRIPTRHREAAF
jgi:hypothetical protein